MKPISLVKSIGILVAVSSLNLIILLIIIAVFELQSISLLLKDYGGLIGSLIAVMIAYWTINRQSENMRDQIESQIKLFERQEVGRDLAKIEKSLYTIRNLMRQFHNLQSHIDKKNYTKRAQLFDDKISKALTTINFFCGKQCLNIQKQFQLFNNYVIVFILLKDTIKNRNTNNYLKYVEEFLLLSCIEDAELTEKVLQDCVLLIKKGIYPENLKKLEMPTIINDEELDKLFRIEVYMYDHFVYLANFFKMYLSASYGWR